MDNVLIHIGYHKTGTTWLQNEVFISESDVFQPLSKNNSGHSTLAGHFIYSEDGYLLNSFDDNEEVIKKHLKSLKESFNYDSTMNKILVMSNERLSGNPNSAGFDSSIVAKRIKKIFPKGKILIVIREQSSWLFSNYFEYLSNGGNHNIEKYLSLKYDGKRPGFSPNNICYHLLIKEYRKKFGDENVLVLPYEYFKKDKICFFETLSDFLGRTVIIPSKNFKNKWNVKSDYYVNYKLRFLNIFIHASSLNNHSRLRTKLTRILAILIKKTMINFIPEYLEKSFQSSLKAKIQLWCLGKFEDSNKITSDLIGMNLEDFGYLNTKE